MANPPAEAKQETQPAPSPVPKPEVTTRELPHTASLLPLIGLIGVSLLGVAALLRLKLRV